MNLARLSSVSLLAVLLFAGGASAVEVVVPRLQGRVTDLTGTLSPAQCQKLEITLQKFESSKGAQVVVLIVPTTGQESVEQFGIRVADQWKIGRHGINDGAILLVAKNDRTLRIEVGRGLEGALPDATASRIINEIIVPAFKNGDFFGGIEAGVERIIAVIRGEPLPTPVVKNAKNQHGIESYYIFLFVGIPIVMSALGSLIGRLAAGLIGGCIMGTATYWMTGAWVAGVMFGGFFFIFCLLAASSNGRGRQDGGSWGGGGFSGVG
ncbi:MAG: YgcG family protein, partial [bacterium]